jgi:DNA-binding response OmpR family regulator
MRVLIAEDENGFRATIAAWLGDEGFVVEQASYGPDAIKLVPSHDFDIALLDIKMPGINSLEVLRFIKKNSMATDIVMMTATGDLSRAVEAMKLGARECLSKPIDLDQLVPQLRSLIQKRDAEERIRQLQAEHTARLPCDLHNPISGLRQNIGYPVKGMAGTVSEHQKELMGHITSSMDRVISILTDMMDLTKLEARRVHLNKGIRNVGDLVQEVAREFHVPLQSNEIALHLHPEADLPTLEFDRQKIRQVLQSILSMAVRVTPVQGSRHPCPQGCGGDGERPAAIGLCDGLNIQQWARSHLRGSRNALRPISKFLWRRKRTADEPWLDHLPTHHRSKQWQDRG